MQFGQLKRREFITLLVGAAAWPIAARGQSSIPVIGFINGSSATAYAAYIEAFTRGLAESGYTVGFNKCRNRMPPVGPCEEALTMRITPETGFKRVLSSLILRWNKRDLSLCATAVAVLAPNTPGSRNFRLVHEFSLYSARKVEDTRCVCS